MLTCHSPLAPASTCWSSGGSRSGSVVSVPGTDFAGPNPSGAIASGADAAATGPALDDSSQVEDPGAGAVEVGVSWRSAALAALMKSKLVNTQVERSNHLQGNKRQTYSTDFFLMAFFIRTARRGVLVTGGGVSPACGVVPATTMVMVAAAGGLVSSSSGPARAEDAEGLQEDVISTTQN
jgi:hypothetical protein